MELSSNPTLDDITGLSPVIPVVKIPSADAAVEVAKALARGGVPVIELTLRTSAGIEAIRAISSEVPEIVVGAGTVTTPVQLTDAVEAGATFIVSPGSPRALRSAALEMGIPALLGANTVTEMMELFDDGWQTLKFFPAEAAGGIEYLSSVRGPLPGLKFCPTGGINLKNAQFYLDLPNVPCVGGSWLTPNDAIEAGNWGLIEQLARRARESLG